MSAPTAELAITEPGVYQLTDAEYHRDPVPGGSLSVSGARKLLPPSCPARFVYERDHPPAPKPEFDLGHAAHLMVLGAGPELLLVDAPDWRTKAAREQRDEAHATGKVPLLPAQLDQVTRMAEALRQHPIASELLDPERMVPEQSVFWRDAPSGVIRRARLDAISRPDIDGGHIIVDYKTTKAGDLDSISRALHFYGYAMQARWYLDAAASMPGAATVRCDRFLFVFQEVEPPHLVTVVEPDAAALRIGHERNRQAIEIYRDCAETGIWPGHVPDSDIPLVSLPGWVERAYTTTDEGDIL